MRGTLDTEDARAAIDLARTAIESYVTSGKRERPGCMDEVFYERTGVFVKLECTRGRGRVRGSAGSFRREKQLSEAIVDAAIEAASENTGRSEVEACEMDSLAVTLCLVGGIQDAGDAPEENVEIGRDGVLVESPDGAGWMLPTMPVDRGWNVTEYLDRTCCKAGCSRGDWRTDAVDVYRFEGQIFQEQEPGGRIAEIEPAAEAEAEVTR